MNTAPVISMLHSLQWVGPAVECSEPPLASEVAISARVANSGDNFEARSLAAASATMLIVRGVRPTSGKSLAFAFELRSAPG